MVWSNLWLNNLSFVETCKVKDLLRPKRQIYTLVGLQQRIAIYGPWQIRVFKNAAKSTEPIF